MKHITLFLVFLFIVSLSSELLAQSDTIAVRTIEGTIIDDSLGYTLPFVHLWNESTRMGGISTESGEFKIKVKDKDTIVFSALGYHFGLFIVSESAVNQKVTVRLKPKTYLIGEAVVKGFRSYESFKQQFLNLDPSDEKTDRVREYLSNLGTAEAIKADRERAVKDKMNGFGYSTGMGGFNKEKMMLEKVARLKKRDEIINAKYNRELVEGITQLSGDELSRFIVYCKFSDEYLYQTDLFTIIEDISNKFNLYQAAVDTVSKVD